MAVAAEADPEAAVVSDAAVAALNRTRTHRLLVTEANGAKARSEQEADGVHYPGTAAGN
jgi:hypothetical protein